MKNQSIWNCSNINRKPEKLEKKEVDILIIGGGITGITTAYFLMNSNQEILLIDKDQIGCGITSKSTAKISYIQKDIYQKLETTYNYNTSKLYYESQKDATNLLINIIKKENLEVNLEKVNSYLFTTKKDGIKKIKKEKDLLEKFGVTCYEKDSLPIPYNIKKTFYTEDNYTFNPKKYINQLSDIIKKKIDIKSNILAFNITRKDNIFLVKTNQGEIITKKVIIANHYPFFILPNLLPLRNYISREYINAAKYKTKQNFTAINIDQNTESIRFYQDYLIFVANNHRLTNNINYKKMYQKCRKDFQHKFGIIPEYSWMNQDIMTNDFLPIIGYSDNKNKDLLIATGYNAWGITNGVIAAKIISDLINNIPNKYQKLFQPSRLHLIGVFNSIIDGGYYLKAYIQTTFYKNNSINKVKINGKNYYQYIDQGGKKHYVKTTCPHMKCHLVFNQEELTWDCPCHGSRFDIDGNIIEGPSKCNISKK